MKNIFFAFIFLLVLSANVFAANVGLKPYNHNPHLLYATLVENKTISGTSDTVTNLWQCTGKSWVEIFTSGTVSISFDFIRTTGVNSLDAIRVSSCTSGCTTTLKQFEVLTEVGADRMTVNYTITTGTLDKINFYCRVER